MQKNARTKEARNHTKVVIGPWNHCNLGRRKQGSFDFGLNAEVNVREMQIRWFNSWLKGIDNGMTREPAVRYFVMGLGKWKPDETWPPQDLDRIELHFAGRGDAHVPDGSGALVHEPQKNGPSDTYTYDPFDPVSTLWDPACFYNVSDRHHVDHRNDILRYCTPPLEEDIEVVGYPEVILYAASSAIDTDFFVRLVDDKPSGPAMEICYGMVRARYRNGFDTEEFLTPGEVTQFRIRMEITACCFRKGHRNRIERDSVGPRAAVQPQRFWTFCSYGLTVATVRAMIDLEAPHVRGHNAKEGGAMKVERSDTWVASMKDKPGALAEKLEVLAEAGANLEFVIARRAPRKPGTGVVFATPIKGAAQIRAARKAGFRKTKKLVAIRVEGPDKPGQGARIARALAKKCINLRGVSAAALGRKFVANIALDNSGDATKAARILRTL